MLKSKTVVLIAGSALVLGGCGEPDEASTVVARAGDKLSSLSPDGSTPAPSAVRASTYRQVANELNSAARSAEGEIKGVASLLAADAELGRAQVAHHELRPIMSRMTDLAMLIQDEIGVRALSLSQASANSRYDASGDRATVNDRMAEIDNELAALRDRRGEVKAEMDGRMDRSRTLSDQAASQRREAGAMRLRAEEMEYGPERVALVTRAVEASREADRLAREADELMADGRSLVPAVDGIDREIGLLTRQLESAQATLVRIEQASKDRLARARESRALGEESATTIRERMGRLMELVNGPFTEGYEDMTGAYEGAMSSLSQAGRAGARAEARAAQGVAEHAAATAIRGAAETLGLVVSTLENVREAGIEVEGLDGVATMQSDAMSRADELRESAAASLGSSGVRGDAGDGFSRLAERLAPPAESEAESAEQE